MQRLRGLGRVGLFSLMLAVPLTPLLQAQAAGAVSIEIRPTLGDTLITRFEQRVEMRGTAHINGADSTRITSGAMLMLSRAMVQGRDEDGTEVTMLVDSVALEGMSVGGNLEQLRRAAQGRRVRLRITPNGSITVVHRPRPAEPDLAAVVSALQSTLPDHPVAPGMTWDRSMAIPVAGAQDAAHVARLTAHYRLDSLSADSSQVWISMHGTIARSVASSMGQGMRVESTGNVVGGMQIDRRLGWWVESHATITVGSTVTPAVPGVPHPARVETRITEQMRARPSH